MAAKKSGSKYHIIITTITRFEQSINIVESLAL